MKLIATAKIEIECSRERVFDYLVAGSTYPRILLAKWPVPGIALAELPECDELTTGMRRLVTLTDGTVIDEEILEFEAPRVHRYGWSQGSGGSPSAQPPGTRCGSLGITQGRSSTTATNCEVAAQTDRHPGISLQSQVNFL